ncbi:tripartite tricarboxylate transporter permease [Oceanibium sediminis]|uniref:tripartite tricarboxylate transporter permease n=1 Tax=Oceanibium sediminis TaxID=2026339 RepID=UPI00130074D5|nr:tripartite tricarboxylate transporter permease [Oceanibium sediminis]
MLDLLAQGLALIMTPESIGAAVLGLGAGIVVGALPGLTATMAVAVLAPFTFFLDTTIGIPFLLGIYKGAIYGGSIPAIVINTPGTAAAAATALDGHALARKGQGRRALEMSLYASVIADMLATLVLIFVAAPLATVALKFSSPEFTMLFLFSLTMVSAVSGNSLTKGLISTALGIGLAIIGLEPMTGQMRYTFGMPDLMGGISLIPLLIGMFALSEILLQAESGAPAIDAVGQQKNEPRATWQDVKGSMRTIFRSSGVGVTLGALPGLGAEISCWISYGLAKRRSKKPEEFGKGSIEGVAAAEAGNNAVCPAALIPMLVFGIPGDTITAVLLGAFMAQGLLPGPLLFEKSGDVVYGLFVLLMLTNVLLLIFGFFAIRHLRKITLVPSGLLYPLVTVLCFAGAFAVNSSFFDLVIMVGGGFVGYLMRKTDVPIPPLVIAMLLAPGLESALRQSLVFSDNSLSIFVTRPISGAIVVLLVTVLSWMAFQAFRKRTRARTAEE